MDCVDEKRIESAFYYPKSKPQTCVGIKRNTVETQYLCGFAAFGEVF